MTVFCIAAALFLLFTVAVGMLRILRGPEPGDRMLAAQLFGTAGVAILLLLSRGLDRPALVDVALVFALLTAVAPVAFVRQQEGAGRSREET
ncbi:monovalent cation/H+ antiporter complex subunit F [Ectothiorhodospira mobilis]|uniref:monovalent cation/H+ antiporter complex subunit F n=1 Tax=Ectothiorhodospira mobilis TaxID=195064 RepID=UPI001908BAD6|nr:monovalent cation/H+ antiporter complex subunit F [Ectothiorhodospira mobilis]MBK1692938.1 multiple resistance and pH regulation protein F [Ectothiorhodospira mobilis]